MRKLALTLAWYRPAKAVRGSFGTFAIVSANDQS